MSCRSMRLALLAFFSAALVVPSLGLAADQPAAGAEAMTPPKPGPQQEMLLKLSGKWKATSKMWMDPSKPPVTSEGIEEIQPIKGGMWISTHYLSPGPLPFEGLGIEGWDAQKQLYTGTWADSWTPGLNLYNAKASDDGKTITYNMTGPDATGQVVNTTMICVMQDATHRSWKSWKGTDTSGPPVMEMDYVRMSGMTTTAKASHKSAQKTVVKSSN